MKDKLGREDRSGNPYSNPVRVPEVKVRHLCFKQGWAICTACLGRLHQTGCTSKPDPKKDCCPARHKKLRDKGHKFGLDDKSVRM